jgi:hypothetical protein
MRLEIDIPDSLAVPKSEMASFYLFLQQMTNRRAQGYARYGRIQRRQRYMSRLKKEVEAYEKNGNHEQLLNVAVYAFLESHAPENLNYHFNPEADSVTRKEFGV